MPAVAAYDVDGRPVSFSVYQFSSGFDKVTIGSATGACSPALSLSEMYSFPFKTIAPGRHHFVVDFIQLRGVLAGGWVCSVALFGARNDWFHYALFRSFSLESSLPTGFSPLH